MSMHGIPLTELERTGLINHGLAVGKPSQLSDVFRHGMKWAMDNSVIKWISVGERLPEERRKSYQVVATCLKKYEGGNYDGQGKKTIVQDWVIRRWPQNFACWFELPAAPEQNK